MESHERSRTASLCCAMLCGICEKAICSVRTSPPGLWDGPKPELFGYPDRNDAWRGPHHTRHQSFLSSVDSRCYICYILHQACPEEARKYAKLFQTFYEIRSLGDDRYSLRLTIELHTVTTLVAMTNQVIEPYGVFKILPKKDVPQAGVHIGLTEDTFSGVCRDQISDWLASCIATHPTCNEDWRTTFDYPIRLLNVSAALGSQVQLDSFADGTALPRYLTMSHCWSHGRKEHLVKLTTKNYEQLSEGFSITALPKKFQDAIKISRWMKVDYLWIDAFCIMQDSRDDWQHQSALMGDIYAGSYCNIAATNAEGDTGCFRTRPVEVVEPYLIQDPKLSGHLAATKTHVIGYDDFWCNSLLNTALHKRAWVLQERLLCPRTIHFGMDQMFWECRKHKACEAYPAGIPDQFSNRRTAAWRQGEQMFNPESTTPQGRQTLYTLLANLVTSLWPAQSKSHVISSEQAYDFWSTTVERYMECDLSFSSDKLVAMAGIANKVKATTGERYLAGLWDNKYLPQSLMWYVPVRERADGRCSERSPSLGSKDYRAPSWSWASLEAKITWNWTASCERVLIVVERTDIEAFGNGTSAVMSAEMKVRGRLLAVQLQVMHKNADGSPMEDGSYALAPNSFQVAATEATYTTVSEFPGEPIIYLDTALSPESTTEAYLLPICTQWRDQNGKVISAVAGLLLKKVTLGTRVVYERIGAFGLEHFQASVMRSTWGWDYDATADAKSMESIVLI